MPNTYFQFKQFQIEQDRCAMKVTTDACLFGGWVAAQILKNPGARINALDIGGGTGLLSLMLAQAIASMHITCLEINSQAAIQAGENVTHSPWAERIHVEHADVRLMTDRNCYDVIVSNPPFYEQDLNSPDSSKNQAHHDLSLNMEQLLDSIDQLLTEDGYFFLLLPARKIELRIEAISRKGFTLYQQVEIRHASDRPVNRYFLSGGRNPCSENLIQEIILTDENGQYSEGARALLADYYLMR